MSSTINGQVDQLMCPAQASKLLDEVVYERVVSCFDFAGLCQFEQDLWAALHECGFGELEAPRIAMEMVSRAIQRFATEHTSDHRADDLGDCERVELSLGAARQRPRRT